MKPPITIEEINNGYIVSYYDEDEKMANAITHWAQVLGYLEQYFEIPEDER